MPTIPKTHVYRVVRDGIPLGELANVVSPFEYRQTIDTAGVALDIKVALNIDTSDLPIEPLETEDGLPLETESGETIYIERQPDAVGSDNSSAPINTGNDITITEYSDTYPNGKLLFAGYISSWRSVYGEDEVTVTCLSYGVDMDNYLILSGGYTVNVEQTLSDGNLQFKTNGGGEPSDAGQSFKFATAGEAGKISLLLEARINDPSWNYLVFEFGLGTPAAPATVLYTTTMLIPYSNGAAVWTDFAFPPITVTNTDTYYYKVTALNGRPSSGGPAFYLRHQSTNPYANGSAYSRANGDVWTALSSDTAFRLYLTGGGVQAAYSSVDPSAILESIIDDYRGQGGIVTYTASSIDNTGTTVSYTFNLNTTLEGAKKVRDLAPADWYWYVDPATNIIYLKETSTTADHTLAFEDDILGLEIGETIERVKNIVYFTGGDTGSGENLFLNLTDDDSIEDNRRGLARITDNRVTLTATGTTLAQNFLDDNLDSEFDGTVVVSGEAYDTTLFKPGQTIGFSGAGTFIDRLVLQIVEIVYSPTSVSLGLGVLRQKTTAQIEALQRAVKDLETIDNPDVPG